MPERTARVVIVNHSSRHLLRTSCRLDEGRWSAAATEPPSVIEAGATAVWQSRSEDLLGGTRGSVGYAAPGHGAFAVSWCHPWFGPRRVCFGTAPVLPPDLTGEVCTVDSGVDFQLVPVPVDRAGDDTLATWEFEIRDVPVPLRVGDGNPTRQRVT